MSYGAYTNSEIRLPGEDTQISLLNALHSNTGNQTFNTYTIEQLDVVTYETELHGVIMGGNNLMVTSCSMLNQWQDLCSEDNSTCAVAEVSMKTLENAMTLVTQGFYTFGAHCEIEDFPTTTEIISRCYQGLSWTAEKGIAEQYPFLLSMFESFGQHRLRRPRRFVISSSIAISIAIGVFSGTAAIGTSLAIAREEGRRISSEQDRLRSINAQHAITNNLKNNKVSARLGKAVDTSNFMATLTAQNDGCVSRLGGVETCSHIPLQQGGNFEVRRSGYRNLATRSLQQNRQVRLHFDTIRNKRSLQIDLWAYICHHQSPPNHAWIRKMQGHAAPQDFDHPNCGFQQEQNLQN